MYGDKLKELLLNKVSTLCIYNDNIFYSLNNWLSNYLDNQYKNNKNITTTFEIKNYSTFDLKVKIHISENYIVYEPYNSAVDRYVIFEILYPFIRKKFITSKFTKNDYNQKYRRINIKHHKYLSYLLKTYYQICTFIFTTKNSYCISNDILKNIYIINIPNSLNENFNLFYEKKINTLYWQKF